jgi:hypothetical protein
LAGTIEKAWNSMFLSGPALWVGQVLSTGVTGNIATTIVGFGDGASFGLTGIVRGFVPGAECTVHKDGFYYGGTIAGTAATVIASGGAGAAAEEANVAAKAGQEGVDLFRHVSPQEFADLGSGSGFRAGEGTLEGKWFAENFKDAATWGQRLNNGDGSVVTTRVPSDLARQFFRNGNLDGIGPARYVEPSQLSDLNNLMDGIRMVTR